MAVVVVVVGVGVGGVGCMAVVVVVVVVGVGVGGVGFMVCVSGVGVGVCVSGFVFQGSGFKGREGFSRLITIPARVDGLTGGVEAPPAGEAYIIQRVTDNYLGSTTTLTSSWFYPYLWAVFYDLTMLNYYHNFISGFRFRGSDVIFFIVDAVMVNPERPFDV